MDTLNNSHLFPEPPTVDFEPETNVCPGCRIRLNVLKTESRTVTTLHIGAFRARETILTCPRCGRTFASEELSRLVAPKAVIAYDVMVHVGKALFLRHMDTQEVLRDLAGRNIRISASEVAFLGKRFILYLALAHRQSARRLKSAMKARGGYILHIDSTTDNGSPCLMTGMDAVMDIVLGNVKIPSENAKAITPFLRKIKKAFGNPLCTVSDMGKGILHSLKTVFKDILNLICHFHFLRDLGKDLIGSEYDIIRKRLRRLKITSKLRSRAAKLKKIIDADPVLLESFQKGAECGCFPNTGIEYEPAMAAYAIIQWALNGKYLGRGYGFPFDRPHVDFAERLFAIHQNLGSIQNKYLRGNRKDNIPLKHLYREVLDVVRDAELKRSMKTIRTQIATFEKLRDAMRIAPLDGKLGLNENGMDEDIRTIEEKVNAFCDEIRSDPILSKNKKHTDMLKQIDKYWDGLFADPIVVKTSRGDITIQPQRTNNIMEHFFRDLRKGYRKKTGNNSLSRPLQAMLADTPLIKNLENENYMTILLRGKECLEHVFADIDIETVRKEWELAHRNPEKIPKTIKRLIQAPNFPEKIVNLFFRSTGT